MRTIQTIQTIAMLVLVACGGEDAPSCQQAIGHFYEAGCRLFELAGGRELPQAEAQGRCQDLLVSAPKSCLDELADLRSCWGGVRSPATSNADCDCSSEQDTLLTCD